MKFFRYLFWGDDIPEKERNQIRFYLKVHKKTVMVYLITLNQGSDQLDITYSPVFLQRFYHKHPPFVVGITKSKESALEVVRQMVEDCVALYGNADLKYYLAHYGENH